MKWQDWILISLIVFAFCSFVPVFIDPYYHKEHVTLFEWIRREIDEVLYGERM